MYIKSYLKNKLRLCAAMMLPVYMLNIPLAVADNEKLLAEFNDSQLTLLDEPENDPWLHDDRWRGVLIIGAVLSHENQVTSPSDTGVEFELNLHDFGTSNTPPSPPSILGVALELHQGRHLTMFSIQSLDISDKGEFLQPITFKGDTFLPGEEVLSEFNLTDTRLQYYYDLLPDSKIILQVGGGLSYQHTVIDISTADGVKSQTSKSDVWIPLVNASFGYEFTPKLSVMTRLGGLSISDQKLLDVNVLLVYRGGEYMDISIGYGIYRYDTDKDGLHSNVESDAFMVHVGYSLY